MSHFINTPSLPLHRPFSPVSSGRFDGTGGVTTLIIFLPAWNAPSLKYAHTKIFRLSINAHTSYMLIMAKMTLRRHELLLLAAGRANALHCLQQVQEWSVWIFYCWLSCYSIWVAYYSIRLYRTKSEKVWSDPSSYLICLITDGQAEGGLTNIQPEGRSVVSSLLSIYILNFSVDFFPPAIPVQNTQTRTAPPPQTTHTHAPSTTTESRSWYLISLCGGLLI